MGLFGDSSFGWIMNLWFVAGGYLGEFSLGAVILAGISSFFMDLAHGLANAFLLFFFTEKFLKVFNRIAVKYGLAKLEEKEA